MRCATVAAVFLATLVLSGPLSFCPPPLVFVAPSSCVGCPSESAPQISLFPGVVLSDQDGAGSRETHLANANCWYHFECPANHILFLHKLNFATSAGVVDIWDNTTTDPPFATLTKSIEFTDVALSSSVKIQMRSSQNSNWLTAGLTLNFTCRSVDAGHQWMPQGNMQIRGCAPVLQPAAVSSFPAVVLSDLDGAGDSVSVPASQSCFQRIACPTLVQARFRTLGRISPLGTRSDFTLLGAQTLRILQTDFRFTLRALLRVLLRCLGFRASTAARP